MNPPWFTLAAITLQYNINYFCNCFCFRGKSCCKSPEDSVNNAKIIGIDITLHLNLNIYIYIYIYIKVSFVVVTNEQFKTNFIQCLEDEEQKMKQFYQCFPIVLKHNLFVYSTTKLS